MEGRFNGRFFTFSVWGAYISGGTYTWRGLFSEFYGIHPIFFSSFINSKETQQATKRSLDINIIFCFLRLVDVLCTHSIENVGPAHSAATTELREHGDEFTAEDFDGNDLTGGNLKLLTRSLKALTREDKPEELDVALDVRPTLVQASNLLVRRH